MTAIRSLYTIRNETARVQLKQRRLAESLFGLVESSRVSATATKTMALLGESCTYSPSPPLNIPKNNLNKYLEIPGCYSLFHTWCKIVKIVEIFAVCMMDSPSPWGDSPSTRQNLSYSPSRFVHSTSRRFRMQIFDFCCWKWTRNITLNCFGVLKLVLVGVMVVLIHLQWLISKFHALYVFIYFLKLW